MSINTLTDGQASAIHITPQTPPPHNELTQLLEQRGTVRAYQAVPVPDSWIESIISHGMRAPTSSNMQAYSVIVIKDLEIKKQLAAIAGGQRHVVECPAFLVVCADLTRVAHACGVHGIDYEGRSLEAGLVASIDAAILGMTISTVAESFGLANVLIGALRNDASAVARVLQLPPRCYAVFGICLGWAVNRPLPKPRTPLYGVIHHNTYDASARARAIEQYDLELANYYRTRGVTTPDRAWTQILANRLGKDVRKNLRSQLNELGFPLE